MSSRTEDILLRSRECDQTWISAPQGHFSPGTENGLHCLESLQFFFLSKVRLSSRLSCEGDVVSSCYNDEKIANGPYAGALFVEFCSIGDFTPHLKVHKEVCFCFPRSCVCFSRNVECAQSLYFVVKSPIVQYSTNNAPA